MSYDAYNHKMKCHNVLFFRCCLFRLFYSWVSLSYIVTELRHNYAYNLTGQKHPYVF